jgi:hypothetical protein
MKLRSGKVLTQAHNTPEVMLTTEIRPELEKILRDLKTMLKNNPKFFNLIVEQSLFLGEEVNGHWVYKSTINQLIWNEYPDLNEYEDGEQLMLLIYDLGQLVTLRDPKIRNKIEDESEEYFNVLRDLVREETYCILPTLEELQEVNISGELQQQMDDLEM